MLSPGHTGFIFLPTFNGLIYSLKGTAVINASDFTMSGSIVANSILIKGKRINIKNP